MNAVSGLLHVPVKTEMNGLWTHRYLPWMSTSQDLSVSVLSVKLSNTPFGVCLDSTIVSSAELQVQKNKTGINQESTHKFDLIDMNRNDHINGSCESQKLLSGT